MLIKAQHIVSVIALCSFSLWAQSERGSIRGTVTDTSGAAIAGVQVTATNAGTGVQTQAVSTDAGNYNIPQLQPGEYIVTTEKAGFKKLVRQNVTVAIGQNTEDAPVISSDAVAAEGPVEPLADDATGALEQQAEVGVESIHAVLL